MNLYISKLYVMQYSGDKSENGLGGACGMCGGEERNTCSIWLGNLKETDQLGGPSRRLEGGLLKWTFKK